MEAEIPELHDAGHIARGEDPPDVVEVSNEDAPLGTAGQGQRGQQLVALGLPVTAGAGDAAPAAVACRGGSAWTRGDGRGLHVMVFNAGALNEHCPPASSE